MCVPWDLVIPLLNMLFGRKYIPIVWRSCFFFLFSRAMGVEGFWGRCWDIRKGAAGLWGHLHAVISAE